MQAIAHHTVLVTDSTMLAVRNAKRRLAELNNPIRNFHPILVVNNIGRTSGLSKSEVEKELGIKVTAMIPDLPNEALKAAIFGEILATKSKKFRSAIIEVAYAVGATADGEVIS
jgi:CO dehydrogenase nickel-insertion accessory protein CooC1